jgi:hypothetical protein
LLLLGNSDFAHLRLIFGWRLLKVSLAPAPVAPGGFPIGFDTLRAGLGYPVVAEGIEDSLGLFERWRLQERNEGIMQRSSMRRWSTAPSGWRGAAVLKLEARARLRTAV